jgi:beta-lactam-binding protein with PASTA domain
VADRRSNSAFPADYVIDQTPDPATIVKPDRKVYLTVNAVSNPTVEVPDVVNLSLRNARIQLQHNGLKVGVVSYEPSRFKNTVLRQSIPPEDIVPQNSTIDLVVSDGLGEKTIEIPNIRGLRLSEAQRQLQKAGIRIEALQFKPSREEEPNIILDYEPHKKELSEGENIKLIVSERYDAEEESEAGAVIDTTDNNSSRDNDN